MLSKHKLHIKRQISVGEKWSRENRGETGDDVTNPVVNRQAQKITAILESICSERNKNV